MPFKFLKEGPKGKESLVLAVRDNGNPIARITMADEVPKVLEPRVAGEAPVTTTTLKPLTPDKFRYHFTAGQPTEAELTELLATRPDSLDKAESQK
jgi:hypothetical protein